MAARDLGANIARALKVSSCKKTWRLDTIAQLSSEMVCEKQLNTMQFLCDGIKGFQHRPLEKRSTEQKRPWERLSKGARCRDIVESLRMLRANPSGQDGPRIRFILPADGCQLYNKWWCYKLRTSLIRKHSTLVLQHAKKKIRDFAFSS